MSNKSIATLMLVVIIIPLISGVVAEEPEIVSTVSLRNHGGIDDIDLGIRAAELSPNGNVVILVGSDGYAHLIDANEPQNRDLDIELNSGRTADFNDIAWHPQGQTALLGGDQGMILRYATSDYSVTNVNNSGTLIGENITSIDWRSGGDFAYIGSESGKLWRFQEGTGFIELPQTQFSTVTDIECHPSNNICLVTTLDKGIGIIDRDHTLTWLGGTTTGTWVAVDCSDATLNECIAFGSGLSSLLIEVNAVDASASSVGITKQFGATTGDVTGSSTGLDGTSIIHLAPFGTIRHIMDQDQAYGMIVTEDAAANNPDIAGRNIVVAWENEYKNGFILTSFGEVVEFQPIEEVVENSLLLSVLMGAIIIAVPGSILGLIFMNSSYLQRKYKEWRTKSK